MDCSPVDSIVISAIPSEKLDEIWLDVSNILKPGIAKTNGELTEESLKEYIEDGHAMLMVATSSNIVMAAIVVELVHYVSGQSAISVLTASGFEVDSWIEELMSKLEKLAYDMNCYKVSIVGRRGWIKKLSPLGYSQDVVLLNKRIGD